MKKVSFDTVVSLLILIVLVVIVVRSCANTSATTKQMSDEQIQSILQDNFDSIRVAHVQQIQVISSELTALRALSQNEDNRLGKDQRMLLNRLLLLADNLKQQGLEVKDYLEINTQTTRRIVDTVYVRDSLGNLSAVPDYIKRLPLVLQSSSSDEYGTIGITYDVQSDSMITDVMIYNQLRLAQTVNEKGEHIAIVSNANPYTYTMPGSSVFALSVPEPRKERLWGIGIQAGAYIGRTLKIEPGIGIGLQYDILQALKRPSWRRLPKS